jgi:hypothetical protein
MVVQLAIGTKTVACHSDATRKLERKNFTQIPMYRVSRIVHDHGVE